MIISITSPSKIFRLSCDLISFCINVLYKSLSACDLVAHTAGPFFLLRVLKCIPAASAALAITPPRASNSLVRWPFPIPPIEGLQLICPMVLKF